MINCFTSQNTKKHFGFDNLLLIQGNTLSLYSSAQLYYSFFPVQLSFCLYLTLPRVCMIEITL